MDKTVPTAPQTILNLARSNAVLALKATTLTVAVIALYFQDLSIVFADALYNEATSHILIVPLILAYLVYRKRKMLRATIGLTNEKKLNYTTHFGTSSGILLCTTAVMLYWYASRTFSPLEYHLLTLPIFTAGLLLVLFNPQTLRQAIFPTIFLVFLVPPPSEILTGVGATLSVYSAEIPNSIVNFLGVHSTMTSELGNPVINIVRPNGSIVPFTVAIPCSGIYSLIGFLIFSAFVAYIVRDKAWKKLAIFTMGFPLVYSLNILRITIMLLIGYQWGQELALNMFHVLGGWVLIFAGTLILLFVSEKILKTQIFAKKEPQTSCPNCNPRPPSENQTFCTACGRFTKYPRISIRRIDLGKILMIILITVLLFSIQAPVYALTKGPAQILIQTAQGEQGNTQILPQMPEYDLQFAHRDRYFENISGEDLSLIYRYIPEDQSRRTIWTALEIAETTGSLHNWEVCLISWPATHGYQPPVNQLDLRDIQILQNPAIIARYFAFQYHDDNQTELVLYWYENTIFTINNVSQQKYVKISLITYLEKPEDVPAAEDELLPFATALANHWEPIKTWTVVAMFLNQNSLILAATAVAFLMAIFIFYLYEIRKQQKANEVVYQKLSKPNQQLLDIITKKSTLTQIAEAYQQVTGEPITSEQIQQRITDLERTGIVKTKITNNQDEPKQIWKTQTFYDTRKR